MLQDPPTRGAGADFDESELDDEAFEDDDEPSGGRAWWAWLLALVFLGGTAGVTYRGFQTYDKGVRAEPRLAEPPAINPQLEGAILSAIAPGWPAKRPQLMTQRGPVEAAEGHVTGLAAADTEGNGKVEYGVSYVFYGLPDDDGARVARPGFAIVSAGPKPELQFLGPPTGGWDDPKQGSFEYTSEVETAVEAVKPGPREVGFLFHYTAESSRGGHLTHGRARLFNRSLGLWSQVWEGETEFRWRSGHSDEVARSASVKLEDRDGDGVAEVVLTPSRYYRHLTDGDRGQHFMAEGPGDLVYRRTGDLYHLAGLAVPGRPEVRIRPATPLYAVRAAGPVVIDGDFSDWDQQELAELTGLRFEDPALMKYRRREPEGLDDLSGEVNLMWDEKALYVRALVADQLVVPGPPGKDLYKGDNLSVWLDMDLEGDFEHGLRDADDWQIGVSPGDPAKPNAQGVVECQTWCWVPKPGRNGITGASKPIIDPYNHLLRGYQLEMAIPWASVGGLPKGLQIKPAALPMAAAPSTEPRRYHLGLAGVAGIGLVLSDADTEYQELGFVSNPSFTWAEPKTFNTLFLVEPN